MPDLESSRAAAPVTPGIIAGQEPGATDSPRNDLPTWRKYVILFIISWMTLAVTFSSTSLLVATPEIAEDFSTTVELLNVTNAGLLVAMGFSSFIWCPLGDMFGRRLIYNTAIFVLVVCSIGSGVAPTMAVFTALRLLGGFTGTYFMVAGQTILADIFEPKVRGRAVGFFMAGSVAAHRTGPCIAGIIVTFSGWRVIYWVQTAMTGLGLALSLLLIPEIHHVPEQVHGEKDEVLPVKREFLEAFNPIRIFKPLLVPRIFLAHATCGFLAATQYGLLSSVRHIVNPRFNLTTPLVSGLFYISPGIGFLVGSIVGGRLSDRAVKHYIEKRNGIRLPKDRLNGGLVGLFIVLPISMLLFGWSLQQKLGGLALPIVAAFWIGIGLMGTFNGLNTYAAEVSPSQRSEVICGKYVIQYVTAAASSAAIVPMVDAIGVGWAFTILFALDLLGGAFVLLITRASFLA
ncbi:putative MFS transporter [Thozetella sp. PMI_491]|nr:putative MFS transporter [Thozetella sp. PMI_491]